MSYEAKVLADSVASGVRLTTLQVTFPRIVLAEFNTHRMFSRNSASSRAIPVEKNIGRIRANPFVPSAFAKNKSGMQAGEDFDEAENAEIRERWVSLSKYLANEAEWFASRKVHKQWANRIPEVVNWHTCIVTATEWENFFALRCNPDAAPEIRTVAEMMRDAMATSTPIDRQRGQWHLPFVSEEEKEIVLAELDASVLWLVKLSVARCARISYLTHDGKRDVQADLTLYDRLVKPGHMSPLEHAAQVADVPLGYEHMWLRGGKCAICDHRRFDERDEVEPCSPLFIGNFRAPWKQHRKMVVGEAVFRG